MIIEFNDKRSTITFNGGRFVCFFTKQGSINKTLEFSVFETDRLFNPLDFRSPLFVKNVPDTQMERVSSVFNIICGLDSGNASWIPNKYLIRDENSTEVTDLEEIAVQLAFGTAKKLLDNEDYRGALLNIGMGTLSSAYLEKRPRYKARFLRLQSNAFCQMEDNAEGFVGINKYKEAQKSLLKAIEIYKDDSDYSDSAQLGFLDYKLGDKEGALIKLKKYIDMADPDKDEKLIQTVNILISKIMLDT